MKPKHCIWIPFFDRQLFLRLAKEGMFEPLWNRLTQLSPDEIIKREKFRFFFNNTTCVSGLLLTGWFINAKGLGEWWQRLLLYLVIILAGRFVYKQVNKILDKKTAPVFTGAEGFFKLFCCGDMNSRWAENPDLAMCIAIVKEFIPFEGNICSESIDTRCALAAQLGCCNLREKDAVKSHLMEMSTEIGPQIKEAKARSTEIVFHGALVSNVTKMLSR